MSSSAQKQQDRAFYYGLFLAHVAGFVQVLALAFPWWSYTETDFFGDTWKTNTGLWKRCRLTIKYTSEEETTCMTLLEVPEYISSTRLMLVFGVVLLAIGTVAVCIQKCANQKLTLLSFLGTLAVVIGGILSWVGVTEYSKLFPTTAGNYPVDLHAAFWMAVTSPVLIFIVGCIFAYRRIRGY